jgi:hypothetical protein
MICKRQEREKDITHDYIEKQITYGRFLLTLGIALTSWGVKMTGQLLSRLKP